MSRTAPSRDRMYRVRRADQLEALTSPVRQEIVDALAGTGPCSIAELARQLGRASDSLYYHMRVLRQAGLVQQAGTQVAGTREERLYELPGGPILVCPDPGSARDREQVTRSVSALLRLTDRNFREAARSEGTVWSGPRRNLRAFRFKSRLSPAERKEVLGLLNRIGDIFSRSTIPTRGEGELLAVTSVLLPVVPTTRISANEEDS